MATILAVLDLPPSVPCPPLEALFTVEEEIGLFGASALDAGMLSGKVLLNLDSEDWGVIFIGCERTRRRARAARAGRLSNACWRCESASGRTLVDCCHASCLPGRPPVLQDVHIPHAPTMPCGAGAGAGESAMTLRVDLEELPAAEAAAQAMTAQTVSAPPPASGSMRHGLHNRSACLDKYRCIPPQRILPLVLGHHRCHPPSPTHLSCPWAAWPAATAG